MKKSWLILALVIPSIAIAQTKPYKRNDNFATTLQGTNLQDSPAGVNSKGELGVAVVESPVPVATQAAGFPVKIIGTVLTPIPTPATTEATPIANTLVQATVIPTALSTPVAIDAAGLKNGYVYSSANQEIWCAFNGSTTLEFPVPPGFYWFQNFFQQGVKVSSGIACHHHGTVPTSGTVEIGGFH